MCVSGQEQYFRGSILKFSGTRPVISWQGNVILLAGRLVRKVRGVGKRMDRLTLIT